MSLGIKKFTIESDAAGKRADVFLSELLPEYSRSEIQRMEKNVSNSHKLRAGEVIELKIKNSELEIKSAPKKKLSVFNSQFSILYEDNDIIAINKPRGMVIYPAAGNADGTLVQALAGYCRLSPLGGDIRPGVVHRIDKDTSGVVVLAKSDAAFRELVKVFSEHKLTRKYIAFVWGVPTWESADIEGNIARSSRNRQKMTMVKTGGKPAKTFAEVVAVWNRAGVSEIKCSLFTGRTHQIRVHLSAHGFPVLTDPVYGKGRETKIKQGELLSWLRAHKGQCLHAEILELAHPISGEKMKFRAPLPDDLAELKLLLDDY